MGPLKAFSVSEHRGPLSLNLFKLRSKGFSPIALVPVIIKVLFQCAALRILSQHYKCASQGVKEVSILLIQTF